jgi:hypothetical protein
MSARRRVAAGQIGASTSTVLNHSFKREGSSMETVFGISAFVGALFSAVLLVLAVVLPISAYAAQKWAHRCYLELETLNRTIDEFTRFVIEREYTDTEGGAG